MNENLEHAQRHAYHALEDFMRLRHDRSNEHLWHSLSHHLRHTAYRIGNEVASSSSPTHAIRRTHLARGV